MIANVNGVQLYYEKTGSGRPLLMVHGNGEDHSIFWESAAELSRDFTCYLPDSRWHGRSTRTAEIHYADMAADMVAFMDLLDLKDVVFYGFSDGGILGLMAAAQSPRISTLIISGANLSPRGVTRRLQWIIRMEYLFQRDPRLKLMLREPRITDAMLKSITAKTLVLAGSEDIIQEKETRHIAAAVPGAELRILEGEGHGSYIIHNTKIAEIISDFCNVKS